VKYFFLAEKLDIEIIMQYFNTNLVPPQRKKCMKKRNAYLIQTSFVHCKADIYICRRNMFKERLLALVCDLFTFSR
jgi:hypothetical protein